MNIKSVKISSRSGLRAVSGQLLGLSSADRTRLNTLIELIDEETGKVTLENCITTLFPKMTGDKGREAIRTFCSRLKTASEKGSGLQLIREHLQLPTADIHCWFEVLNLPEWFSSLTRLLPNIDDRYIPTLVKGRQKSGLTILENWLKSQDTPRCCTISGAKGSGKSRLLQELTRRHNAQINANKQPVIYLWLQACRISSLLKSTVPDVATLGTEVFNDYRDQGPDLRFDEFLAATTTGGTILIVDGLESYFPQLDPAKRREFARELRRFVRSNDANRLIVSYRANVFESASEENSILEDLDPSLVKNSNKLNLKLASFTPSQADEYLAEAFKLNKDQVDIAQQFRCTLLGDASTTYTPLTLSLIARNLPLLTSSSGDEASRATRFYENILHAWFETDERGAVPLIAREDKIHCLQAWAAEIQKHENHACKASVLRELFRSRIISDPMLQATYQRLSIEQYMKEMLTHSLLERNGDDQFKFVWPETAQHFLN